MRLGKETHNMANLCDDLLALIFSEKARIELDWIQPITVTDMAVRSIYEIPEVRRRYKNWGMVNKRIHDIYNEEYETYVETFMRPPCGRQIQWLQIDFCVHFSMLVQYYLNRCRESMHPALEHRLLKWLGQTVDVKPHPTIDYVFVEAPVDDEEFSDTESSEVDPMPLPPIPQ